MCPFSQHVFGNVFNESLINIWGKITKFTISKSNLINRECLARLEKMEKNNIKLSLESDNKFILSPDVSLRIVNGKFLYYNRETETVFSTSNIGYEILSLCDGRTVANIVDILSKKYSASLEVVYNDVVEFLKECLENQIVLKILNGYYTSTSIFYELARGNYKKDLEFYYKLKNFIKNYPKKIIDLGGGSARLLFVLTKIFKDSDLFCVDSSWQMIARECQE